jgi:hypothetical protein
MMLWTDHVVTTKGRAWSSVAIPSSHGWLTDDTLGRAMLRTAFLRRVAALHGWEKIPVPQLPQRFDLQLKALLAAPDSGPIQRSIELIMYEIYALPTALIWEIEAS